MRSMSWEDVLLAENVNNLFPMHHRPNSKNNYSIFLISDESQYNDILHNTSSIDYEGTEKADWINKKFYDLASQMNKEIIKIYFKYEPNVWSLKGYYVLESAKIVNGKYRFWLDPVQQKIK